MSLLHFVTGWKAENSWCSSRQVAGQSTLLMAATAFRTAVCSIVALFQGPLKLNITLWVLHLTILS